VEPLLVALILDTEKLGEPLDKKEFLEITMSMIKGMPLEQALIEYRRKHCGIHGDLDEDPQSSKWYYNFLERNKEFVKSMRGEILEASRQEWCTLENFVKMYDMLYEKFVKFGLAVELPEEEWYYADKNGDPVVSDEQQPFNKQIKHNIIHP
jgi:hypothetical protein